MDIEQELMHVGVGHEDGGHSGRYPWGSGEKQFKDSRDFYDRINILRKEGLKDSEISELLGFKNKAELETAYSIAKDEKRTAQVDKAKELADKGYGATDIGKMMADEFNNGKPIGESTIRSYLNESSELNMRLAMGTAKELRDITNKFNYIDVGKGSELSLNNSIGITETKLNKSLKILEMEGYEIYNFKIPQVTNPGKWTTMKVLCKPGTTYPDVYKAAKNNEIRSITDYAENITRDDGKPSGFIYPKSMDSKRLFVRSADEGGAEKDGVLEIRPGVKDLSLSGATYSQVRILVDDKYYIKGMAVYGNPKDFPEGVDAIFNTNKSLEKMQEKGRIEVGLKDITKNLAKDPTNPFGSAIKELGGQSFYDDPDGDYTDPLTGTKQSLSLINKRSDEGDWDAWAKKLPSQFLSKQSLPLIRRQLKIAEEDKEQEFKEIMDLTNPTIKKKLLEEFASDCDSSSVHLQAAALPGQAYKVILPISSLKDDEVYAPHLDNGSRCALIRFPHEGIFQIPILKVNNNNKEGQEYLSTSPTDAVGINSHVAGIMSGADFDGDTVMVIPITSKTKINNMKPLEGLKDFDSKEYASEKGIIEINGVEYGVRGGHKFKRMLPDQKQKQMGIASNLITDMTLGGASTEELARAVRYSMTVIDAEKHCLDYMQCFKDNKIDELKAIYQKHKNSEKYGGASTLISRASGDTIIPERKEGAVFSKDTNARLSLVDPENRTYVDPESGKMYNSNEVHNLKFDPKTGEKVYTETGRKYYKANIDGKTYNVVQNKDIFMYKKDNKYVQVPEGTEIKTFDATQKSTKMAEVQDAKEIVSVYMTPQELAYAEYANKLKSLANEARKQSYTLKGIPQNVEAKAKYKEERNSLEYKYNQALANAPKERQAQLIAGSQVAAIIKENPEMDTDHRNKLRQTKLKEARLKVGAARRPVEITDREWEAIQSGAIAPSFLEQLIRAVDADTLKSLATPRDTTVLNSYKSARIRSMANAGYTTAEIARYFGISTGLVSKAIHEN